MNILIFGVGRSGTKAVRIYLAYYMAKYVDKKLWLNYEPYYWKSNGIINYEGIYNNVNSKQLMNEKDNLSKRHISFLKKMNHSRYPTITKFIRANGRIDQITKICNPEYIVGVIRPLNDVLASLSKFNWDFFSTGNINKFEKSRLKIWNTFINDVDDSKLFNTEKEKEILKTVRSVENWKLRNAFYWYVMNFSLLKSNKKYNNFILIDYRNLSQDSLKAAKEIFKINESEILDIKSLIFREPDSSKDNNFPFKISDNYLMRLAISTLNSMMYKLYDSKFIPFFKSIGINSGYRVTLRDSIISKTEGCLSNSQKNKKDYRINIQDEYSIQYKYMQDNINLMMKTN